MSDEILTVAMASYDDFSGVYFTTQSLKLYHPEVKILVLDNAPQPCEQTKGVTLAAGGKYVHRPDLAGTSASRDALFRYAETDWVAVVDSHVMFSAFAIRDLEWWIQEHRDSRDLIQGPLLGDDGKHLWTHWNPVQLGKTLWGEWATDHEGLKTNKPFAIPMQGLGFFCANKKYWPGFNQHFRGFGGEEGYIHEKYRQRGNSVVCLPSARWVHRFRGPANPAPYQVRLRDHTVNLLIGHREMGLYAENKIFEHFGKRLMPGEWDGCLQEAEFLQPRPWKQKGTLKIGAIWYTNNAAPDWCMDASLRSIEQAARASKHQVKLSASVQQIIVGMNLWKVDLCRSKAKGHGRIIDQMNQAIQMAGDVHIVCFLEHDVLYPADYFDRVAEAFLTEPASNVVSNLDYEGLNGSGWLAVKERHEPMHQLSMRLDFAKDNLARAKHDHDRDGSCLLEPQGERKDWYRIPYYGLQPAIHINHPHRFTSHGEVCYEPNSYGKTLHRYWGDYRDYWQGEPLRVVDPPAPKPQECVPCKAAQQSDDRRIEDLYRDSTIHSVDINEHMPTLCDLATTCQHVTELSFWINGAGPSFALAAQESGTKFVSIAPGRKPEWDVYEKRLSNFTSVVGKPGEVDIDETDLLFIDTVHTADQKCVELSKYAGKVKRYIVLHDTETYRETGPDGNAGILPAVRNFIKTFPEWIVIRDDRNNNGLLVLSRQSEDKKKAPSLFRQAMNYAKAMARFNLAGRPPASERTAEKRMELCLICSSRNHDICGECGCPLDKKTLLATEACPLGKWGAE